MSIHKTHDLALIEETVRWFPVEVGWIHDAVDSSHPFNEFHGYQVWCRTCHEEVKEAAPCWSDQALDLPDLIEWEE